MTEQAKTKTRYKRLTQEERADMVRRYLTDKQTIRQIAASTKRGYNTVWKTLTDEKVQMRRRGGNENGGGRLPLEIGAVERATIVEMRAEGRTLRTISNQLSRSVRTVVRVLDEENAKQAESAQQPS
jgi:IS30 family transposase